MIFEELVGLVLIAMCSLAFVVSFLPVKPRGRRRYDQM
jgi:hypothetical protein